MGTYLSTPKTEKQSADGEGARVRYGLASMQGWRTTMEDAVSLPFPPPSPPPALFVFYVAFASTRAAPARYGLVRRAGAGGIPGGSARRVPGGDSA